MNFIELTDKELVDIAKVDAQHLKYVELLNKLHDRLGTKYEGETKRLLMDLRNTLREHFDTEEKLMKEYNYYGYFSHKLEHNRVFNKVDNYIKSIEKNNGKLDSEFLESGRRWFFNHFRFNDKKCADHLKAQGVS